MGLILRVLLCFLYLVILYLLPRDLDGQSLQIKYGTTTPDTVYLVPGDSIPLKLSGKTAAGGTVTPKLPAWTTTAHCVDGMWAQPGTVAITVTELSCGLNPGWLVATATVSSVAVKDSVFVARPAFAFGSARAICLSTVEGSQATRYTSRDSSLALALALDNGAFAVTTPGVPDSGVVSFGWQVGYKVVPFRAISCVPGYRAADVTRSTLTTWVTDDTTIAKVSKGDLTWRKPKGFLLMARWKGRGSSWVLR